MANTRKKIFIRFLLASSGIGILVSAGLGVAGYQYFKSVEKTLPELSTLRNYEAPLPTRVYSKEGVRIGEIFDEKRYPLTLKEMSPVLVQAFLAAEDSRFYEHDGIDYPGVLRAGLRLVTQSGGKQGGSTITQQLAKNLLLTRERTFERKIKDMILAKRIEQEMNKDDILELYLNTIFLGNNSYGIEAAAKNYFRKSSKDLSLAESALIAGLPPAPSAYAPTESMERAKARQRYVLQQLVNGKKISREDAERAYKEAITVYRAESPNATVAPYFFFEVKKQLENALNIPDLTSGGYEVHTTLDMQLQRQAVSAVHEAMKEHEGRKGFRGPLKRHGEKHKDILKNIVSLPLSDGKLERAVVVDIIPALDAAAIVSQRGLGLLLLEDHRWALRTSRSKGSSVLDFADILRVGDEINVQLLERGSPSRIVQNSNLLSYLSSYLTYYPAEPANKGVRYYGLTDTEGVEAAALVMNATNGEVLAMVGGTSFENSQFNRTTQAKRQVGSSVKSLYYALAFDHGFSPASQIDSPPIVIGDWKPENYDREFLGRTTLRKSFIHSYNIPSIQLLQAVGADVCATHFKKLGFDWPESDFSIALGAGDATLLQMTQAYSPFANEGRLSEAVYITKILDRHGKVLFDKSKNDLRVMPVAYQEPRATQKQTQRQRLNAKAATREALFQSDDPKQVLSPQAAFLGVRIMQDVVRFGTGTRANATSHAAGKTGTTNAYTDAWFMGVVPNLVGGVWVGYDDARKSLGANGTGGRMAAPIWREVMKAAAALYPAPGWKEPSGITNIRVDADTGQPIFGAGGIVVPVVTGTEPGSPRARNALGLLASDSADDTGTGTEEAPDLRSVF